MERAIDLVLRRRQGGRLPSEMDLGTAAVLVETRLVGLRPLCCVGRDVPGGVGLVEDVGELRAVMGGGAGDRITADEPLLAVVETWVL